MLTSNQIGQIPFPNHLWNGYQIIAWFLFFSTIVIVFAYLAVKYIKIFAIKFNLSTVFVGGIILSTVTSLPEFFTGILGGVLDHNNTLPKGVIFTLFNVTGANALQVFILALLGFYFFWVCMNKKLNLKNKKNVILNLYGKFSNKQSFFCSNRINLDDSKKKQIQPQFTHAQLCQYYSENWNPILKGNFVLWLITFIEYLIMLTAFIFPDFGNAFNVNGFSFLNFFFLLFWIGYLIYSYHNKTDYETFNSSSLEKSWAWKINKYWLFLIVIITSGILSFVAYLNSGIVDHFSEVLKIPENAAAGFILSVATSLPEITLFITLVSKKLYVTAGSGLLGSSVFNLSIPFYSNVISLVPLYGTNFVILQKNNYPESIKLIPWMILSIILYGLLYLSMQKNISKKIYFSAIIGSLIFIGYIIGFIQISQL